MIVAVASVERVWMADNDRSAHLLGVGSKDIGLNGDAIDGF
jgi:hypothetical protein